MKNLEEQLQLALNESSNDSQMMVPAAEDLIRRSKRTVRRKRAAVTIAVLLCAGLSWSLLNSSTERKLASVNTDTTIQDNVIASESVEIKNTVSQTIEKSVAANNTGTESNSTEEHFDWQWSFAPAEIPGHITVFATRPGMNAAIPVCIVRPAQTTEIPFWQLTPGEQEIIQANFADAGYKTNFEL